MRRIVFAVLFGLCLHTANLQLVCYQCADCEFQQEIPVVCGDISHTTTNPPDTTCPTCAPEPTPPTTPEWTTSTPDTTCPTCEPTLPTTPIPTTVTPETTCPTCAPTLPTSPIPTTSTPIPTTPTPPPITSTPETTCPTCAPTLPTTPPLTTSTPFPSSTTPTPTQPPPTLPTSPPPTFTTQPYCPPGCCPCSGARATSVFAMATRAVQSALLDEFEEDIRSPRQLPLPVYVCYTTERFVSNRRVISRGCTKRQQSLGDTCTQVNGGQAYEQCSLCSWQLCNR